MDKLTPQQIASLPEQSEYSLEEAFEFYNSAYIIGIRRDGTIIHEELQPADYWVGGEDDGTFTSDSNINFDTLEQFENYLKREYKRFYCFEDEDARDEFEEENGLTESD